MQVARLMETDSDTSQISAVSAGRARYNAANASLYRAVHRLEQRGLVIQMSKRRGDMQLTQKGILAAEMLQESSGSPRASLGAAPSKECEPPAFRLARRVLGAPDALADVTLRIVDRQ